MKIVFGHFSRRIQVKALLAFGGSSVRPLDSGVPRRFKFAPGQAVYIVSNDLQLERRAGEQFAKDRQFKVAGGLSGADVVFVGLLDTSSPPGEELALVLLPDDYSQYRADVDALRDHALWRAGGQLRGFGSEVKRLVRKFEREVLQSAESKESR